MKKATKNGNNKGCYIAIAVIILIGLLMFGNSGEGGGSITVDGNGISYSFTDRPQTTGNEV